MTKLDRMYKALNENSEALANGGDKSYYIRQNERLSILIAKEEKKRFINHKTTIKDSYKTTVSKGEWVKRI